MFNLDTTQALVDLTALEQGLRRVHDHQDDLVADAVDYTVTQVKGRVQLFGEDSDGNYLESPSRDRLGSYSYSYGMERQDRGLQTSYVDLTVTGELMAAFQAVPDGPDTWAGGFTSPALAQRADKLEAHFGATIFEPTEGEIDETTEYYNHNLNQLIDRV